MPSSEYCVSDLDAMVTERRVVHQYRTKEYGRSFQLFMILEIKTQGADLSKSQRDTLHILNQIVRNRRQTPTKVLRFQAGNAPLQVHSLLTNQEVNVRHFGVHLLRFSGLGPDDSDWIKWNKIDIDADTLTQLLRFDLDPDTLKPMDESLRNHHSVKPRDMPLFDVAKEA